MSPRKTSPRPSVTDDLPRLAIENVSPELDGGRFPVKRIVGATLSVGADIFKDGHDLLAAHVRYRAFGETEWKTVPMRRVPEVDRWFASIPLDRIGRCTFVVEAWTDRFRTWRSGLEKKVAAGQSVPVELMEGSEMVAAAAKRLKAGDLKNAITRAAAFLKNAEVSQAQRVEVALDPTLLEHMETWLEPEDLTTYPKELGVLVDRERAAFASWYELFPRSETHDPAVHGTFRTALERLPRIAELGFDVIYLPPIHPIGRTFRKGKNNTLTPEPDDVGSPWAIGGEEGGHTAVHPDLGTVEDFEAFVRRANELGMEIALDYALQCSPDHPWVKEHPDWFRQRPDGTIMYAENPPKKYQDIYPIHFWCEDRENLWNACRDVFFYWIERGVKTFRVDNPHTKPFAFWEWAIAEVQAKHPDVVFLSEAFTAPKRLLHLAKLGFSQSYTYFTWKNSAHELREWMAEFSTPEILEFYRGNLFANTPDILHEFLQAGGPGAFRLRLLLAGTLAPLYGIYSGYELYENVPVRAGSEEYLNSEKYEIRPRDYEAPGNLNPMIARLNQVRRENYPLQRADNLSFHLADNERILFYRKAGRTPDEATVPGAASAARSARASTLPAPTGGTVRNEDLLVVVNLDPYHAHHSYVHVPVEAMGIHPDEAYQVQDLLTGDRYTWRGSRNYVHLDPSRIPGHILRVER